MRGGWVARTTRALTRPAARARSASITLVVALSMSVAGCIGGGDSEQVDYGTSPSSAEASRFLAQASFGANSSEITKLQSSYYPYWFEEQFAAPQTLHKDQMDAVSATLPAGQSLNDNHVVNSFWKQAISGQDQLRQRVAFALSQIFVVSLQDSTVSNYRRGVASYLDMLGQHAFGNFRELLEGVTRHPMMGLYLSHLRNQKESGNRVPDQNYAREVMQLFTIGLYELNPDGTQKLVNGQPDETYTNDDIVGLSRVFTGFSWAGPDKTDARFNGSTVDPSRDVLPMQSYPKFHSTLEKRFLGTVIPAQGTADPDGSLRIALDALFNHPNVGPFFGKQLIQRLVTSNPSAAYVGRVAQAFATGRYTYRGWTVGSGARGDMKATITAVLLDAEARDLTKLNDPNFGKVREPVLRAAAWMRAFGARSASGNYLLGVTDDAASSLGQSAMRSPSVFNFYRPGYVPPNTNIATANLVAPEFQIIHESSVVGYGNFMRTAVQSGVGSGSPRDIQPDYSAELALADNPDALIERLNLVLMYGAMTAETKTEIRTAMNSVSLNVTNVTAARQNRVYLAVLFATSAPEFIVQK